MFGDCRAGAQQDDIRETTHNVSDALGAETTQYRETGNKSYTNINHCLKIAVQTTEFQITKTQTNLFWILVLALQNHMTVTRLQLMNTSIYD